MGVSGMQQSGCRSPIKQKRQPPVAAARHRSNEYCRASQDAADQRNPRDRPRLQNELLHKYIPVQAGDPRRGGAEQSCCNPLQGKEVALPPYGMNRRCPRTFDSRIWTEPARPPNCGARSSLLLARFRPPRSTSTATSLAYGRDMADLVNQRFESEAIPSRLPIAVVDTVHH